MTKAYRQYGRVDRANSRNKPAYILYSKLYHGLITICALLGLTALYFCVTMVIWSAGPLTGKHAISAFIMAYGGTCMSSLYVKERTYRVQYLWTKKFLAIQIFRFTKLLRG